MMEEVVKEREDKDINSKDVIIDIKDGSYTWGFLAEQDSKKTGNGKTLK